VVERRKRGIKNLQVPPFLLLTTKMNISKVLSM
jgi:hypothetical protein